MRIKTIDKLKLVSHSGFFYRANNRGTMGLNWAQNLNLPIEIRECGTAINLPRDLIDKLSDFAVVCIDIYYRGKLSHDFKGRFQILFPAIKKWIEQNGYYVAKSGRQFLAIPISICNQTIQATNVDNTNQQGQLFSLT